MKRHVTMISVLILFSSWSGLISAGQAIPVVIEGEIGDFAPKARVYEIGGKIYTFREDLGIHTENGKILTFEDLKGGTRVRLIGESASYGAPPAAITFTKIVVMNTPQPVKEGQKQKMGISREWKKPQ